MTSSNKLWFTREMAEAHRAEGLGDGGGTFHSPGTRGRCGMNALPVYSPVRRGERPALCTSEGPGSPEGESA